MNISAIRTAFAVAAVVAMLTLTAEATEIEVVLKDAGEEPRRELRYTPEVGVTQRVEMTIRSRTTAEVDGTRYPTVRKPEIVQTVEFVVDEVEDGLIHYSGRLVSLEVKDVPGSDPEERQRKDADLEPWRGLRFSATITDRGIVESVEFDTPGEELAPSDLEDIEYIIREHAAPVPEEPVGLGAEWVVKYQPRFAGVTHDLKVTNRLVAIDEQGFTVRTESDLSAEPQAIDADDLPPGDTVRLVDMKGTGGGEFDLRFDAIAVVSGDLSGDSRSEVEFRGPQFQQKIKMRMRHDESIRPANKD